MGNWLSPLFLAAALTLNLGVGACSRLLYYPTQETYVRKPQALVPPPQDIFFKDAHGRALHGWYFEGQQPAVTTLVVFHGNAQNVSSHFASLYWILAGPYNLFIFDYPGYGKSQGEPTPQSTVESGKAALGWARKKSPEVPLVVVGQSLGGPIALRSLQDLGVESGVRLLVLDSSFLSYRGAGASALSKSWLTWPVQWLGHLLLSDAWAPETAGGKVRDLDFVQETLVLHGEGDPVVSFKLGQKLFEALPEPKVFWKTPSRGHIANFHLGPSSPYREDFILWLEQKARCWESDWPKCSPSE